MKENTQSIAIWSLACAISIMVVLSVFIYQEGQSFPLSSQNTGETIMAINYGNGKIRKFQGPVAENERVWNIFQQAVAIGGINVEISDHFIPENIDGLKNTEGGKRWNLYVNNIKQKFAPFEIYAKPGDEVVFKYE